MTRKWGEDENEERLDGWNGVKHLCRSRWGKRGGGRSARGLNPQKILRVNGDAVFQIDEKLGNFVDQSVKKPINRSINHF